MSGTLASVAPYDRAMSASMPRSLKNRSVRAGYSVEILTPWGRSSAVLQGESPGTASTMRIGREVFLEYWSWPSDTTSLPVSATQSRPVMPRSKSPLAT